METCNVPGVFLLKILFRIMPPLLSQPLGVPDWADLIERLSGLQEQLLALPPSHGQALSNAELFDSILDDVRRMINPRRALMAGPGGNYYWEYDF
jgi:hypothetical protein